MRVNLCGLSLGVLVVLASGTASAVGAQPLPARGYEASTSAVNLQFCATRSVTGSGIHRRSIVSPVDGVLGVRTSGGASADWDLGILDAASGAALSGSAQRAANEYATALVRKGQRLTLQTCRRTGTGTLAVRYAFTKLPKAESSGYQSKLVRVATPTDAAKARLAGLGLDTADHPTRSHWEVMLYSKAQERELTDAGLEFTVRITDVRGRDRANRLQERRNGSAPVARARARASIVSGRTSYRTLPEIEQDLKRLAQENPGLVRLFALPGRSWEGREMMGVEIAENVTAPPDGRPAYVQVGTHHAREWPANEATLEWGLELVEGYKRGDPRLAGIVKGARNYVVPVLNVDGFNVTIQSEGLTPGGSYVNPGDSGTASGAAWTATGAYKRKNCRPVTEPATPEPAGACLARSYPSVDANTDRGVDPNRNYGVEWGGPGSQTTRTGQTYHGPAPFSEPETEAFRRFVRNLQPSVLITNHTYTGLILRPPGTATFGPVPDEDRLRALGDAMGRATGYVSQYAYQLYDTTGTTDDYLYDALGAFSYTTEIGKVEFHPAHSEFVAEYDGRPEVDPSGQPTGRTLGGLREAYTLAGETALDPGSHSVIEGAAPAGRTLRIRKDITYRTSERPDDNGIQYPVQTITESRQSTLVVPGNGRFVWHVNPSGQPRAATRAAWTLTCEDGAGNVLGSKAVEVGRSQSIDVGTLACGDASSTLQPATNLPVTAQPGATVCGRANGFRWVRVSRRARGLRISFRKRTRNPVTVAIFRTAKGRTIVNAKRVARFRNRQRAFTWNGRKRSGTRERVPPGGYVVRFRVTDDRRRVDSRRIFVEKRKSGRFVKRGKVRLETICP
jgi:hypothetical protein